MLTSPLAHHLVEIAAGNVPAGADMLAPLGATHSTARLSAADTAGYERGRAAALSELKQSLSAQEQHFAELQDAARRLWVERESDRLAACLSGEVKRLEHDLADSIVRVLAPFVLSRLRETALEGLAAEAERLMSDSLPLAIDLSGPEDLTTPLAKRLKGHSVEVRVAPGDAVDLKVQIAQSVLETRLKEWTERITRAIA